MPSEHRLILKHIDQPGYTPDFDCYVRHGGYEVLKRVLGLAPRNGPDGKSISPQEQIREEVVLSGLRGRGGAGFSCGTKWALVDRKSGKPIYLICNADESEPGTFKDRQILYKDPHQLLEGMVISGYANDVHLAYIYIRGEFVEGARVLDRAIAEAKSNGCLGTNILGSGYDLEIHVHRGAGAYICGEETGLIESIEGKRAYPRIKPPYFPAVLGLYMCPTIVNNVETLACVPYIVREGVEAFRKIGTPNNFGPKIFGVSGHVARPGAYEFPLGVPLARVIEAAGGVVGELKAVIVGGLSTPILTAEESSGLLLDYDSCLKAGTALGSGGVIVMNDTVRMPEIALRTIRFYAHESCGQCTPCRQGSAAIEQMLHRVVHGGGAPEDLENVLHLCKNIRGNTLCPTGDALAMPIEAMISKFRPEFDALVR